MFTQYLLYADTEIYKISYKISRAQVIYLFNEKRSSTVGGEFLNSMQDLIIGEKLVVKATCTIVSIVMILLLR